MGTNVADLVRDAARRRPDHPALVAGDQTMSWSQLDQATDSVAAALAEALTRGDRVAIVLANSAEFVVCYFAVLRAGLVAVPLNPGYTTHELQGLLADSGAALVITDTATVQRVRDAARDVRLVVVGATDGAHPSYDDLVEQGTRATRVDEATDPDDLALLLYTSGTSGRPKGAMLTHRALQANVDNVAATAVESVVEGDRVLVVLPMFHVYTLNGTLAMIAREAATAVVAERFDPRGTLELVARAGVTNVPGAPAMWAAWSAEAGLGAALSGVRMLFTGAAPLPPAVRDAVTTQTGLPLHEGYGLTEAAPGVSSTLASSGSHPGTVGRPLPGVEVRILDESGETVVDGDPGEIWIRGANLFSGYWPDGDDGPDADGWFGTGDVAYLDDDGELVLVDRRKELVIVSGFNVYPREVEEAIQQLDGVAEVAVVGVSHPITGEAVKAFVVPQPGVDMTPDMVLAHAASRLARFKCPTIVEVVLELPHSATGKVAKGRLREGAA